MKSFKYPTIIIATLILLLFGTIPPAQAIIFRHDLDSAEFLLPEDSFPAVFDVYERNGGATLIAPQWAITAAHVARSLPQDGSHSVTINGAAYAVEEVYIHPDWEQIHINDIALFKLSKPVTGVDPIPLYRDDDEVGQTAIIVGRGDFGTGLTGATEIDGQLRRATNIVEKIESGSIWFRFDEPESPNITPFEGVAGPGDSGGPALIEKDGRHYLIGVASFGIEFGNPPPEPGTYNSWDTFTNISHNQDWIDETVTQTNGNDNSSSAINETADSNQAEESPNNTEPTIIIGEPENNATSSPASQTAPTILGINIFIITAIISIIAIIEGIVIIYYRSKANP